MTGITHARTRAQLELCAELVKWKMDRELQGDNYGIAIYDAVDVVENLAKIARTLQNCYTNVCSYPWANTPTYEKRVNALEAKAGLVAARIAGLAIEFQRDPRGWPLIVKAGPYTTRLG